MNSNEREAMKIVSVQQMQSIEKDADESGISYQKMMQTAGLGVATWIHETFPEAVNVVGLVGSGNNGGDTLIAMTWLSSWGLRTTVFLAKERQSDGLVESYLHTGGSIVNISRGENIDYLEAAIEPGTIVLDGILGTGLKLPLRGALQAVMGRVYAVLENRSGVRLVAVDCPSGVDCDTGEVSDVTLTADDTLCMAAIKQGLLKHPAREKAGELHSIDIGIGEISNYISQRLPEMITCEIVEKYLPKRPYESHKGTFGTCFVIAGTPSYTGAAYLTGKAAYRAGCGLVHIATPAVVHQSLAGHLPEAVWTILPDIDGGYGVKGIENLLKMISKADSMVIGPGWGLEDSNIPFLTALLEGIPKDIPTVFDADGLKLLRQIPEWWQMLPERSVLTPHPGEMSILTDLEINEIQSNRWEIAREYAEKWRVCLVLKGAETVVADHEGSIWVNPVSEPALATAGSGDVLSGLIGGLLAQGTLQNKAAVASVWLHGQAGILAKAELGSDRCVTAVDILDAIPKAFGLI